MVVVTYKVTVSDDGKKSNSTATVQIKTAEEDMTLFNVSVDKTSAIISDFNENTAENFKETYKEELTSSKESSATNPDKDKSSATNPDKDKSSATNPDKDKSTATTEDKKNDSKKENASNKADESKKDTASNSNNSTATNSKPASKPSANTSSSSNNSSSGKPSHTHNWVAQYTTVHHDAQYSTVHHDATGHYETQTVSEGYYSEEPVYFTGYYTRCFVCNAWLELDFNSDWEAFMCHVEAEKARYGGVWETHQVGTEQVWHDPVTQQVWVEDSPAYDEQVKVSDAYDEQVVSGYTCSSCGATE